MTTTTTPTRTGSVRILRSDMVRVLGAWAEIADVSALAAQGGLLLRITSETKNGPVAAVYRVEAIAGGYTLTKGQVGAKGEWIADGRDVYNVDTSFDKLRPTCDCPDARRRMHTAGGSECKHRKSLRAVSLVS